MLRFILLVYILYIIINTIICSKSKIPSLYISDCIQLLLQKKISLCEMTDDFGWTPLHYAAELCDNGTVLKILEIKSSAAYICAGRGDDWTTIFHITARYDNIKMMKYLSNSFPDCWAMINSKSRNILHEAMLSGRMKMIEYMLKHPQIDNLVDQKDKDGNTPLHLLATSSLERSQRGDLERRLRRKHLVFNKWHQTPLDLACPPNLYSSTPEWTGSRGIGPRADLIENQGKKKGTTVKIDEEKEINHMLRMSETMIVVTTLILTITFAAGFAIPGGYDSNPGKKQGQPILLQKAAFRVFIVADIVGFTCSMMSIFIYVRMVSEATSSSSWKFINILGLYNLEIFMILLASGGVIAAFFVGLYATLAPPIRLPFEVIAYGLCPIVAVIIALCCIAK